jgi:hypothetical protein
VICQDYARIIAKMLAKSHLRCLYLPVGAVPDDLSPYRLPAGAHVVLELVRERGGNGQPARVLVIV